MLCHDWQGLDKYILTKLDRYLSENINFSSIDYSYFFVIFNINIKFTDFRIFTIIKIIILVHNEILKYLE